MSANLVVKFGNTIFHVFENAMGKNTTLYVRNEDLTNYLKKGLTKKYIPMGGEGVFMYEPLPAKNTRKGVKNAKKTVRQPVKNKTNKSATEKMKRIQSKMDSNRKK